MKKIIVFGNWQAGQLSRILDNQMDSNSYLVEHISNIARTGNMQSLEITLDKISQSDILIYQPLSEIHGKLSESYILNILKPSCISVSFPYIFNNGIYSLLHAPQAKDNSYGLIHGENVIVEYLKSGLDKKDIISLYERNEIDFKLIERFESSISIMQSKEASTDIKLVNFIKNNYLDKKLFITHNHPTNELFFEMLIQLSKFIDFEPKPINEFPQLAKTNCPISPYDISIHGYKFQEDEDYFLNGKKLINLIVNSYLEKKCKIESVNLNLSIGVIHSAQVNVEHIKTEQDINIIRDASILLQNVNIYTSLRLMELAHIRRPTGPFISKKLEEFNSLINT